MVPLVLNGQNVQTMQVHFRAVIHIVAAMFGASEADITELSTVSSLIFKDKSGCLKLRRWFSRGGVKGKTNKTFL